MRQRARIRHRRKDLTELITNRFIGVVAVDREIKPKSIPAANDGRSFLVGNKHDVREGVPRPELHRAQTKTRRFKIA